MIWTQNYNPTDNWILSTFISALPVLTLFIVLIVLRKKVWFSALCGFIMAILIATVVFKMPLEMSSRAALLGMEFGFIQIAYIIVGAVFLYNVTVESGKFEIMKDSIVSISADKRIQVILIAFCFGAFLEGTAGGGAPVAIAGTFLIGLRFPPFEAAIVCLIANTAPVAWGAVGSPVRILAGVTDIPVEVLTMTIGRILPIFSLILPIWIITFAFGWKRMREVLPVLLVAGISFSFIQFFWSNFMETGLVDIMSGGVTILVIVVFMRYWKPKTVLQIDTGKMEIKHHHRVEVLRAWSPFILSSVCIFIWGFPVIRNLVGFPALKFPVAGLHEAVIKVAPIVSVPTPENALIDFNFLAMPGTGVFVGAFLSLPLLGVTITKAIRILWNTFYGLIPALAAICLMVGLAFVTRYCGMDTVLGLSLTRTGWLYPFFGTLLGWLGVGLTGTDGGSNALFGNLQKQTAEQLGLNPALMASANSAGGVMGKMISAQSIVVSSSATQQVGNEANIFKALFKHSILLACLIGILVMIYAYLIPWMVPTP